MCFSHHIYIYDRFSRIRLQTAANCSFQSDQRENVFKISDYLEGFDKQSNRGKCKACHKTVAWSKDRLSGHKRASCPDTNEVDKIKFAKI